MDYVPIVNKRKMRCSESVHECWFCEPVYCWSFERAWNHGSNQLTRNEPKRKQSDIAKGDVSGLIGMVGPDVHGLCYYFWRVFGTDHNGENGGERPEKLDAEVGDMVGEVTNMICGNAKRDLLSGVTIWMATPIVVSGKQHTISHQ